MCSGRMFLDCTAYICSSLYIVGVSCKLSYFYHTHFVPHVVELWTKLLFISCSYQSITQCYCSSLKWHLNLLPNKLPRFEAGRRLCHYYLNNMTRFYKGKETVFGRNSHYSFATYLTHYYKRTRECIMMMLMLMF